MNKIDANDAHDILQRCGISEYDNFYALTSSQVSDLLEFADTYKYRKPKNANGSRGRYFHAMLTRRSD